MNSQGGQLSPEEALDDGRVVVDLLERHTDRLNAAMEADRRFSIIKGFGQGISGAATVVGLLGFMLAALAVRMNTSGPEPSFFELMSFPWVAISLVTLVLGGLVLIGLTLTSMMRRDYLAREAARILQRIVERSSHQIDHRSAPVSLRFALEISTTAAEAALRRYVDRYGPVQTSSEVRRP